MTENRQCDVVIVGAGPAGLSAARTAARLGFETVVVEKSSIPGGGMSHYSAVLTPVPGFVVGRRTSGNLFFPSLDLLIPEQLIRGHLPTQRFVSPGGYSYEASFGDPSEFMAAVVDKAGLLRLLAFQARSAGARLRYGVMATGLLTDGDTVTGVETNKGPVAARMVLAAEGAGRQLCEAAGFYEDSHATQQGALLSQDMEIEASNENGPGQIVTFGSRYSSARQSYGMVTFPAPGRATVYLAVLAGGNSQSDRFSWFFMNEYVQLDPRIRKQLHGGRVLRRARQPIEIRSAPTHAVRERMLGIGDAVTPGGHLGVLPAMHFGRQAALMAAECLDAGRPLSACLQSYEKLLHASVFPNLEAEMRMMNCLTQLADDELDRLCQALNRASAIGPLLSNWRTFSWEMMGWLMQQLPAIVKSWDTFQAALIGEPISRDM